MFRKLISVLAISSILLVSSIFVFAKASNDWTVVESLVNQEIAMKSKGKMKYGIVKSVDTDSLVLQLAGKKSLTQNESTINKDEIKKIWRATLFVNNRRAGKGALIGAGIGAGAGTIFITTNISDGDGQSGAVPVVGAIYGAAIGGAIGFFVKKKHKRRDLVYKR